MAIAPKGTGSKGFVSDVSVPSKSEIILVWNATIDTKDQP